MASNERSKVRKFVDSIKTKSLDTIKGQIMASAELRTDFDKCTTLFKDFLAQDKLNGVERSVAVVGQGPNLSYVPKDEWNKLSQSEKDAVDEGRKAEKACRQEQGGGGGKGGGGGGSGTKPKSKDKKAKWAKCGFIKHLNKAVDCRIKALESSKKAEDDDENDEVPMKDPHSMRQGAKKKSGN